MGAGLAARRFHSRCGKMGIYLERVTIPLRGPESVFFGSDSCNRGPRQETKIK